MNNELLDDLKQFMVTTTSQSEARLRQEIAQIVGASEFRLRDEMRAGFAGVAEVIEGMNSRTDKRFAAHEKRLRKLEHRSA